MCDAMHGAYMQPLFVCVSGVIPLDVVAQVVAMVGEVMGTRVQLTFTQLQNFIADVAIERNLTYFFWGHADAGVLAGNASASFGADVMGCMQRVVAEQPRWGAVFFRYDHFAAYRVDMLREVRWDIYINHYLSDCDFYISMRAAGWQSLEYTTVCPATTKVKASAC